MHRGLFFGSRSISAAALLAIAGVTSTARAGNFTSAGTFQLEPLAVTLPKSRAMCRVSARIRGAEVTVSLDVTCSEHKDEVAALYPTGRVTRDGWVEAANDHVRPVARSRSLVAQARVELLRGPHDAPTTPAKRALEAWRGRK